MDSKKIKTRQPIQVWSPLIFKSIFDDDTRRDFSRAEKFYIDADIIWLSPEASKITSWEEKHNKQTVKHMMVPSETINKIVVYHIDKYGNIFPPIAGLKKLEPSLYLKWLKSKDKSGKYKPIKIPFPKVSNPGQYYKEIEMRPIIKYKKIHDNIKIFPKKIKKTSVNFETEDILYFFKNKKISKSKTIWPKPFNHFFLDDDGLDLIYYHVLMNRYLSYKNHGYIYVLNLVKNLVNAFITDGVSTIEKSWFNPKKENYENETGLISEMEGELKLKLDDYKTLKEVTSSEVFKNKMKETINIKRAYSWLGYFWQEFYLSIPGFKTARYCENCGAIIFNCRKNQKYCIEKDNPDCRKRRWAKRQKKSYNKANPPKTFVTLKETSA